MSSNVCGNCSNFKPKPGENFLNCVSARHAGLSYGMQVRADTRACDAFMPFGISSSPTSESIVPENNTPVTDDRVETIGLCAMGQRTLVATVSIAIVLVSWLLYTCARL